MNLRGNSRRGLWERKALRSHADGGFVCKHCGQYVSSAWPIAGVRHRNHCPYCLHSRHLDLWQAGDRLSACKGDMRPVGLTFKRLRKKYGGAWGELMLVHRCQACGKISANRVAADDDSAALLALLDQSSSLANPEAADIQLLGPADIADVRIQLYGRNRSC